MDGNQLDNPIEISWARNDQWNRDGRQPATTIQA